MVVVDECSSAREMGCEWVKDERKGREGKRKGRNGCC
jgi:hypothetical protein